MIINKAYKIRLYPNKSQLNMIEQSFGCSRFIYNSMLAERKAIYELHKDDENRQALWEHKYKTEKDYKQEFAWLKDVESSSLQQARIDLSRAYTNFFNSLSGKSKGKSQFPKFHRKGVKESYRIVMNNNNIKMDFDLHKIKIPKLGWVNYRDNRQFDNNYIKQITVSKSKTNKYFASILVQIDIPDIVKLEYSPELMVKGLDMSMEKFYVDNNGDSPDYIRRYREAQKHLSYLQRQVSKKQKGSVNRKKAQLKLNKCYEKIANSRKDFIEKLSTKLLNENDVIVIESLNMQSLAQSLHLGKSVNDLAWGMFVNRLQQKSEVTNKLAIKADKFFASSQICHVCGYKNKDLTLKDREWDCPICGTHLLRDENAGQNLKQFGLNKIKYSRPERPGEPVEMSSAEESMKQESYDFRS